MTGSVPAVGCMPLLDCGPSLAHPALRRNFEMARNPRYASRYPLPARSGHPRWPAPLQSDACAIRLARSFRLAKSHTATAI